MGLMINGKKIGGLIVGGKKVTGIAYGGKVIFRSVQKCVINQYPYTGSIPLKSGMQIVINNVSGTQIYNGVTLGFDNKVQSVKIISGNATAPQVRNDGTLWFLQINVPLDIAIAFVGFPEETVLLHFEWHNDGTVPLTFGSIPMNINLTSAHS